MYDFEKLLEAALKEEGFMLSPAVSRYEIQTIGLAENIISPPGFTGDPEHDELVRFVLQPFQRYVLDDNVPLYYRESQSVDKLAIRYAAFEGHETAEIYYGFYPLWLVDIGEQIIVETDPDMLHAYYESKAVDIALPDQVFRLMLYEPEVLESLEYRVWKAQQIQRITDLSNEILYQTVDFIGAAYKNDLEGVAESLAKLLATDHYLSEEFSLGDSIC